MPDLTISQLLKLTVIQECHKCKLRHALSRTCEEAREWQNYLDKR